ncbi:MAG TPA: alpha/beta fold hydrolase [Nocardioidaceae bacterium]|nr:alpha/beta fold hydrolase [Nocardioidaceae bacterium]
MSDNGYRQLKTPDGRTLEYLVEGDPHGYPLVHHHGTPGAAIGFPAYANAASERGLALIHYSRAGYGQSSPRPDRTVADVAEDIAALLDHLGHDEFVTLGWSGGGPHSLACAARLPGRCRAAATGAGVAPFLADDLDFLAGMGPENHEEFGAALEGRLALEPYLEKEADAFTSVTAEQIADALGGLVSPVDEAYATGEFAARTLASFKRACMNGIEGWAEDDLAFTRHWGFELNDLTVPVSVWQGAEDRMVPFSHGQWLAAHIPGAAVHLDDHQGHLSLWARIGEILDDLLARRA